MTDFLTREDILEAEDLDFVDEVVPEWKNKTIRMVQMNAEESIEFNKDIEKIQSKDEGIFLMLIHSARDENRNRIFTHDDIAALRKKSFRVLNRLQNIALKLNSLSKTSVPELKNV